VDLIVDIEDLDADTAEWFNAHRKHDGKVFIGEIILQATDVDVAAWCSLRSSPVLNTRDP